MPTSSRTTVCFTSLLLALLCITAGSSNASETTKQPNVLIIMADDCTFSDLPSYGGQNAKTPNLDALASQSLVFDRAYLCSAMCQPCRAELYSGQYPMRNGCAWNHSSSRNSTTSLPHYLGDLGYRVGLAGKVHVTPTSAFPFELVQGFDKNCVRNPTRSHKLDSAKEFLGRSVQQRFCLVVALVEPHVPWVMGDASQYPVDDLELPPHIADTPRTRRDFAAYLAEITYMDNQVGEILDVLEKSGQADNTLVLFTSEQGAQFPGCKWTNWDTGVHTALMARWPGKIQPGRTDVLVQYADVAPTLVDAATIDSTDATRDLPVDGSSFLKVLLGEKSAHRQFAYGMHNNYPEGPAYPIRSITDGRFHYIRNLSPESLYIEKHLMGVKGDGLLNNRYWQDWVWNTATDQRTYHLVSRYQSRPAEELYDLSSDPSEMNNLAGDPAFSPHVRRLSNELDRWMLSQGDPGAPQDTPAAHAASKKGNHLYVPPTE
ncbi:MAG: sulfatase [Aureliella sp.]